MIPDPPPGYDDTLDEPVNRPQLGGLRDVLDLARFVLLKASAILTNFGKRGIRVEDFTVWGVDLPNTGFTLRIPPEHPSCDSPSSESHPSDA